MGKFYSLKTTNICSYLLSKFGHDVLFHHQLLIITMIVLNDAQQSLLTVKKRSVSFHVKVRVYFLPTIC